MEIGRKVGVVGSRAFQNYRQVCDYLDTVVRVGDTIISGGAVGVDSMGQRYAKEKGLRILIIYPNYRMHDIGATFVRNREIVEESDRIIAFYAKGRFQQGGTANTIEWARKLGVPYEEYEEQ